MDVYKFTVDSDQFPLAPHRSHLTGRSRSVTKRRKLPAGRDSLSTFESGADPWGRALALYQALALTSENDLELYRPGCALEGRPTFTTGCQGEGGTIAHPSL